MWFGKSLGRRRKVRETLTRGKLQKATRHLRGRLLKLEPLEERMLLAVDTAFDLVSSTLSIKLAFHRRYRVILQRGHT